MLIGIDKYVGIKKAYDSMCCLRELKCLFSSSHNLNDKLSNLRKQSNDPLSFWLLPYEYDETYNATTDNFWSKAVKSDQQD